MHEALARMQDPGSEYRLRRAALGICDSNPQGGLPLLSGNDS